MGTITMTNGHRYKFAASAGTPVLLESSDNIGDTNYFNNVVEIANVEGSAPLLLLMHQDTATGDGPSIFCRNLAGGDVGIAFDLGGTDFVIGMDAAETDRLMIGAGKTPSATDGNNIIEIKDRHEGTTSDDHILVDFNPDGDSVHSIGKVRVGRAGICGSYHGSYVQQIWSIGYNYSPDFSHNSEKGDFGDLYGIGYFHPNSGNHHAWGNVNTSSIAGGHQIIFCANGDITNAGVSIDITNGRIQCTGSGGVHLGTSGQIWQRDFSNDTSNSNPMLENWAMEEKIAWAWKGMDKEAPGSQRGYLGYDSSAQAVMITTFDGTWRSTRFDNGGTVSSDHGVTSDERLKKNIVTLTGSLDVINQLRGVSFDWKDNNSSSMGFIAQEIEQVLPVMVGTQGHVEDGPIEAACGTTTGRQGSHDDGFNNPDDPNDTNWGYGSVKHVKYNRLIPVLSEAIKELSAKIDSLESRINVLENA